MGFISKYNLADAFFLFTFSSPSSFLMSILLQLFWKQRILVVVSTYVLAAFYCTVSDKHIKYPKIGILKKQIPLHNDEFKFISFIVVNPNPTVKLYTHLNFLQCTTWMIKIQHLKHFFHHCLPKHQARFSQDTSWGIITWWRSNLLSRGPTKAVGKRHHPNVLVYYKSTFTLYWIWAASGGL